MYKSLSTHGIVDHIISHVTATVPVAIVSGEAVVSGQDQHTREAPKINSSGVNFGSGRFRYKAYFLVSSDKNPTTVSS